MQLCIPTAALGSQPAAQQPLNNRGCYMAYFGLLQLQPAPSMHQGSGPYLRQCKCTKFSFKFQFWWASQCTCLISAIFTLLSQPSVKVNQLTALHYLLFLCISCIVLGPHMEYNLGLTMQPIACSGSSGPRFIVVTSCAS